MWENYKILEDLLNRVRSAWKSPIQRERLERREIILQRMIYQLESLINNIEANRNRIPLFELAKFIVSIWKVLNNLELLYTQGSIAERRPIPLERKDFKLLKMKLINLISKTTPEYERRKLSYFMGMLVVGETNQLTGTMKKELTERRIPWYNTYQTR